MTVKKYNEKASTLARDVPDLAARLSARGLMGLFVSAVMS